MGYRGLLQISKNDLKAARAILVNESDELMLNTAAYFTQQSIEKALKHSIGVRGFKYPNEYRIELLIDFCKAKEINYPIWLQDMSYIISYWAIETRYNSDFKVIKETLVTVLEQSEEWIKDL